MVLVGFGSYDGTVIAADRWGGRARVTRVPPARAGSLEELLHGAALPGGAGLFLFDPGDPDRWPGRREYGHRAIGVVYRPEHEARGNYVPTVPAERYDAFVHLDRTTALVPLAEAGPGDTGEEETWPSGL